MKTAVFAYSKRGCDLALRIKNECQCLRDAEIRLFTMKRMQTAGFEAVEDQQEDLYRHMFSGCELMVFIGAVGIAVRKIAPFVKDKKTDPAVICIDEKGTFVIPVLSGHIGGANRMAGRIAESLNAIAVITTATDINGKFAADEWAAEHGFGISDMELAKYIAGRLLESDVPLYCEFPVTSQYPSGTFKADLSDIQSGQAYDAGIYIGCRKMQPFKNTLRLIPAVIRLGIGCRKGTGCEQIAGAVSELLEKNNIDERAVSGVYSIDLKADEPGLREFCAAQGWDLTTYSAQELKNVKGDFSSSAFVQSITGVDNVCERAACMDGKLIVPKTAADGVTVAAAVRELEISFI